MLSEAGRPSEAEPEYRAALAIFRDLAEDNPAVTYYRNGLAYIQIRRGILLSQAGRLKEAEAEFRSAAAIFQALADQSPKVPDYADGLASALTQLGDVVRSSGRAVEARDAYDRAIALREPLVEENPTDPDLSRQPGVLVAPPRAGSPRPGRSRRGRGRRPPGALGSTTGWRRGRGRSGSRRPAATPRLAGLAGTAGSGVSAAEAASEADAAIALLKKAVAMGYRIADAVRTESALDPLRDRPDFRLLMMDLAMPADPFAAAR